METATSPQRWTWIFFLIIIAFTGCTSTQPKSDAISKNQPSFQWESATPESQGVLSANLDTMKEVLAAKSTKKLLILKNDKIIYEWHAPGWSDSERKHYTASLAKAIVSGMSLLGAMNDGYITPDEAVCRYVPEWKNSEMKSMITVRQLATHTSGLTDAQPTPEELEMIQAKGLNNHFDLPGWRGQFWRKEPDPFTVARDSTPCVSIPGTKYSYSNPGIAMLTYAVTASMNGSEFHDIRSYLKKRIYEPIGIEEGEYTMGYKNTYEVDGLGLVPGWGGGAFTARAIARIGMLMLHKGNWQGNQILDSAWVERVTRYAGPVLPQGHEGAETDDPWYFDHLSPVPTLGWYNNFDGIWPAVPRDAFAGGGAGNQHLFVIPSMNMVIVRMGEDLYNSDAGEGFWDATEKYLLNPIMDAITEAPYPESNLKAVFAPEDSIIRLAEGSDNWPVTSGDDGSLYTAYGDGYGFVPNTEYKLSLGLAKVEGEGPSIQGVNLRSASGERVGQGKFGEKASGLLMVDGVLYMIVRNANNSCLLWSNDHGKTWESAPWKFDVSFGCPTFLNYGKNYEGAIDRFVYIYSNDDKSAYKNTDHFIVARVPSDQIKDWRKYKYFAGFDDRGKPVWTEDIRKREAVFTNPGKCYRSGITYDKGLKKFLWCQSIQLAHSKQLKDQRFRGGLGIFESDYPWGPWKTVFYTRNWDTGPGETSSIPTKWISADGMNAYLLFSGDDYFSLRHITFIRR